MSLVVMVPLFPYGSKVKVTLAGAWNMPFAVDPGPDRLDITP